MKEYTKRNYKRKTRARRRQNSQKPTTQKPVLIQTPSTTNKNAQSSPSQHSRSPVKDFALLSVNGLLGLSSVEKKVSKPLGSVALGLSDILGNTPQNNKRERSREYDSKATLQATEKIAFDEIMDIGANKGTEKKRQKKGISLMNM